MHFKVPIKMSIYGVHLNKRGVFVVLLLVCIFILYRRSSYAGDDKIFLSHLLQISIKSAQNGGIQVVNLKDDLQMKLKGLTKEGAEDRVTAADYLSHCAMVRTFTRYYPSLAIISEEAKSDCSSDYPAEERLPVVNLPVQGEALVDPEDVTVWIDPLDATQEYTEKLYEYVTTMVCVAVKGIPIMGVIHKPFEKKTYWAWVGYVKSPDLIHSKTHDGLKVLISRSHSGQIRNILGKFDSNIEVTGAGGAGYKALQVAHGLADAYLHVTNIKKWDVCAGDAVLRSLGGLLTTTGNLTLDYGRAADPVNQGGIIAALSKDVHDMFVGKL